MSNSSSSDNLRKTSGWLNIYKPRGISSAKAVSLIKRAFRGSKIGHTGTLDLEAEGVLPIAIGEATKLVSILIDAKKRYNFTVKFGAKTDTADSAGKVIETSNHIPSEEECHKICSQFIGKVEQIPPAYSALKVNGQRAYKLARAGEEVKLAKRCITIYDLKCTSYDHEAQTASYVCDCSKGTYIRTLAEDISLSLQSLGFVLQLRRLKVGMFDAASAVDISDYMTIDFAEATAFLQNKCLKIEDVLDDIPVLEASESQTQKIRFGQNCQFEDDQDYDLVWVRHNSRIVAIGSLLSNNFKSSRVFNL
ncbi:MAG: tRNA pseudouridine(55) synthase TruB [Rickettsiales bacterium]|nr:MAG: tRNA pseudouridine(55) synthase TruB [Rickettsiales bacterium]